MSCASGPNSIAKSVVEPDNGERYAVYYTPVEVGLYNVAVKWNGKEIEGFLLLSFNYIIELNCGYFSAFEP